MSENKDRIFNFPTGEMHVILDERPAPDLELDFHENEDIIALLLTVDAMKRRGVAPRHLSIPYVPFSRQDRVTRLGEPLSIAVFAELINNLGFSTVTIMDPHSDVTPALIKNCVVIEQNQILFKYFENIEYDFYLISPDAGATKKIHKLANRVNPLGVIECSKARDTKTGEITDTLVPFDNFKGKDCYIVDDICDGGRTFIEIAKILRIRNCGKIVLMVTHGFFTKGLEVFDGLIDEIYTRKGRVK